MILLLLLLLFLFFYLVPATISYLFLKHKLDTEWNMIEPDSYAIALVVVPLLNIGTAFLGVIESIFSLFEELDESYEKSDLKKKIEEKNVQKDKSIYRLNFGGNLITKRFIDLIYYDDSLYGIKHLKYLKERDNINVKNSNMD